MEVGMAEEMKRSKGRAAWCGPGGSGGGAYLLAMVGAAVYYVQQASGFWPVIVALLKALVWPAFLIYHVLQFMH
jgi:hypothetical protein